jgi:predicted nucleic acid-binding protein
VHPTDHPRPIGRTDSAPEPRVEGVVLDTNVVLDWLYFEDPAVRRLAKHIAEGGLRWEASPAMRAELAEVLGRTPFRHHAAECERTLAGFDFLAQLGDWRPLGAAWGLFCADPDDQMFVDHALACGARWLFTRDKALLSLAARACRTGVLIREPRYWEPEADTNA